MSRDTSTRNTSTGIQRGERISLMVDQREVSAYAGETVATVLLAQGITIFNRTLKGQARGPYCNMGSCFECQVQVVHRETNTFNWVRACMVTADAGMKIVTGATLSAQPGKPTTAELTTATPGGSIAGKRP
jgi:sarcosine oxidase subunit alpha